jgi:hypothetical protein
MPLRDAEERIKGWAGTVIDIDEIVRGEASLLEEARVARFWMGLHEQLRELTDAQAMVAARSSITTL